MTGHLCYTDARYSVLVWIKKNYFRIKFIFCVMCYGEAQPRETEQNDEQAITHMATTHGFHFVVQFISFFWGEINFYFWREHCCSISIIQFILHAEQLWHRNVRILQIPSSCQMSKNVSFLHCLDRIIPMKNELFISIQFSIQLYRVGLVLSKKIIKKKVIHK